ncbi:FAD-dependent monooxygenase [Streptomyces sp. NRRL F-5123]|uniref:FAD-dependent monooxygenase n=1 Tax=Streptomyces sp. NRRL F-5123 TaxID=1463856 RepID=UPI0004E2261D|nr:FAD-dependent monooxygenase [Streptomyces sp. NRRL F-5123]
MSEEIVVVGAGPAGLMLACELGLRGVPCTVLERSPHPTGEAPGLAVNAGVVELLAQRGIMDALRPYGIESRNAHFAQLWLDPSRLPGHHPYTFAVAQSRLQSVLEERAADLGVKILRGHTVVGLRQDTAGVTVTARTAAGESEIRCGYLVGCDGRRSRVRELAGIGFPGSDFPFHGIVGDVTAAGAAEVLDLTGATEYPGGLLTVRRLGPDHVRVMTAEFDVLPEDAAAPVTAEELRASLRRLAGVEAPGLEARWLSRWDVATRLADRFRDGRVFLAGESAHTFFPLGGKSMSTAVEDAVDLGWKLAAAAAGRAPAGLLDTYEEERRPVADRACRTTAAQAALLHPLPAMAPLRDVFRELIRFDDVNAYLVRMAADLDTAYSFGPEGDAHPLTGRRLADVPLRTADGETSVARLLHSGRGLVLDLAGAAAGARSWADGRPGQVDVVAAEPVPGIDAALLVVRPDGRVAWAGDGTDPAGALAALTRWFGPATA